jgi:hypothetical protein
VNPLVIKNDKNVNKKHCGFNEILKQINRVKSRYVRALSLEVIYQPIAVDDVDYSRMVLNPVWENTTRCNYIKALRLSELFNEIAIFGHVANIGHELERLAINVWRMDLKSFSGLVRRIRSKIFKVKSPETMEWYRIFTINPASRSRVHRCTKHRRPCQGRACRAVARSTDPYYASKALSIKIKRLVRDSGVTTGCNSPIRGGG